jgi:hypothetical protein
VFLTADTFSATEQQVNTIFCFELGKTATETYEMLRAVYCDEALSHSCVFE